MSHGEEPFSSTDIASCLHISNGTQIFKKEFWWVPLKKKVAGKQLVETKLSHYSHSHTRRTYKMTWWDGMRWGGVGSSCVNILSSKHTKIQPFCLTFVGARALLFTKKRNDKQTESFSRSEKKKKKKLQNCRRVQFTVWKITPLVFGSVCDFLPKPRLKTGQNREIIYI